jgi:hypothetical protein
MNFKIGKTMVIAAFCLLAGGLRPCYTFITVLTTENKILIGALPMEDYGDGEEEDSSDDDDAPKVMVSKLTLHNSFTRVDPDATFYQDTFKEHHPEIVTPPPKS